MAAQALVTTGPQACLEGAQYLAKMADVRQNLGTLLEIFSDNEAATELIRPEGNKITATLGCDLDPAMPGACIVSKRYLAGGGLTGSVALIGCCRSWTTLPPEWGRAWPGRANKRRRRDPQ